MTGQDYIDEIAMHGFDAITSAGGTAALQAVNAARRDLLNERRWGFMEVINDGQLTIATGNIEVSTSAITDLLYIDAVRMQDDNSNTGYDLQPVRLADFRRMAVLDRTLATPQYWAATPGASPALIFVGPRTDRDYTLLVDYVKTADDFATASDDETVIPQSFKTAVVWKAIEHLCFRRNDQPGLTMASQMYSNEVQKLAAQEEMGDRQQADEVVSSGFWDPYTAAEVIY